MLGQNEVGAAGAQRRYHANIGTAVALTVRDGIGKHALKTKTAIQQIHCVSWAEPIVKFFSVKYYKSDVKLILRFWLRTNEAFTRCSVARGRDRVVEIAGEARGEECGVAGGRGGGRVCARVTRAVPSCILSIDRVEQGMEGEWAVTVEREERGRPVTGTARLQLVPVSLPSEVTTLYSWLIPGAWCRWCWCRAGWSGGRGTGGS